MVTLTDAEVAARKAQLLKEIEIRQAELEELSAVERYMKRLAGQPSLALVAAETPSPPHPPPNNPPDAPPRPPPPGRIEGLTEAIVAALKEAPDPWMTANQIQDVVSESLKRAVPMSSISPKLSDLKNKQIIRRDDMRVALASRVDEDHGL